MKAIMIIPSTIKKDDRFVRGVEWTDGWGFDPKNYFAVRIDDDTVLECKQLPDVLKTEISKNIIIWMRHEQDIDFDENVKRILQITKTDIAIWQVAYHRGGFIGTDVHRKFNLCKSYSLEKRNQFKFDPLLIVRDGQYRFNKNSDFNTIEHCFFKKAKDKYNETAIAIVCQCHLTTLLADPQQQTKIKEPIPSLIGWNKLPMQTQSALSGRLQQTHAKLQTLSGWAELLGFFDKAKNAIDSEQKARLLIAIINDMDGKAKAEALREQLAAGSNPADIEARIFDNADAEYSENTAKVLKLFQHDKVEPDTVCAAYRALAAFLSPGS